MGSWISWVMVGAMIVVLLYAMLSIFLNRSIGLYIAATFHVLLGVLSLPSFGLYVMGLAIVELIIGIVMSLGNHQKRVNNPSE